MLNAICFNAYELECLICCTFHTSVSSVARLRKVVWTITYMKHWESKMALHHLFAHGDQLSFHVST